ncbi:hypothetical protein HGRIS_010512 [Hohenbuehelia grisea]|uniref:Uncharacterized protein n=1 Tax=Hohenbuehelia grisea TaxID=104357 RepID=A0ABR3IX19_9AGAR
MDCTCPATPDDNKGFGDTISGGIQDIAALLPLLGTEQCEEHVGSALADGYLYAAVAPLSIFGSLGIVRAGGKALLASVNLRWRGMSFVGAEKLQHAGFGPAGKSLRQILWDGANKRHVAETELIEKLEKLHIREVDKLSVKAKRKRWNWSMIGASVIVVFSITPYIYFFIKQHDFLHGFFPLARSFGSLITAIATQFIIQVRLLEIIKRRIVFMTIDNFIREEEFRNGFPPPSKWAGFEAQEWNVHAPSESALLHLEAYLYTKDVERQTSSTGRKQAKEDTRKQHLSLQQKLDIKGALDKAKENQCLPCESRWELHIAQALSVIGILLSIVGYAGCFSLVKGSPGSYIWLGLEVFLALVRMGIWTWNPGWDDDTSLEFSLALAPHSPLPTCNKFSEELDEDKILPLARSREFLAEMTSFTGLLEPLENLGEGIALYYSVTWCEKEQIRMLYVLVFDYKEKTSRRFIYPDDHRADRRARRTWHPATIKGLKDDTEHSVDHVEAELDAEKQSTDGKNWHVTKDPDFIRSLEAHCESILRGLRRTAKPWEKISFTWALERSADSHSEGQPGDNSSLDKERQKDDFAYLRVGKLERHRRNFCSERSQWVDQRISLVQRETLADLPPIPQELEERTAQSAAVLCEAAVAEYLILYEWQAMERMLIDETRKLEFLVLSCSKAMIDEVKASRRGQEPESRRAEDSDLEALERLERKITVERIANAVRRVGDENLLVQGRVKSFAEQARRRIHERKYRGSAGEELTRHTTSFEQDITDAWTKLLQEARDGSIVDLQHGLGVSTFTDNTIEAIAGFQRGAREEVERIADRAMAEFGKQSRAINTVQRDVGVMRDPTQIRDEKEQSLRKLVPANVRSDRRQLGVQRRLTRARGLTKELFRMAEVTDFTSNFPVRYENLLYQLGQFRPDKYRDYEHTYASYAQWGLKEAIKLLTESLDLCPPGHPTRDISLTNLGNALQSRYEYTGELEDLDKAIELHTESLELRPTGDPARELSLTNLGNALKSRYEHTGDLEELKKAIDLYTESLECYSHPTRDISLTNLGNALKSRYEHTGDLNDLDKAIEHHTESLDLRPTGDPSRHISLINLVNARQRRYERTGNQEDLDKLIDLLTESLDLYSTRDLGRDISLTNLVNARRRRYERTGNQEDLDKLIDLLTESLDLCPAGDPARAITLTNLGNALQSRYERTGDLEDLDKVIEHHTELLNICPTGHPTRDISLTNLGNALQSRYERTGDREDLDKAIEHHTESLELRLTGHSARDISLTNLGNALQSRYERTGDREDLDKAIEHHTESLDLRPTGDPTRDISLRNLGNALQSRYESTGDLEDLDKVIELHTESLDLCPISLPHRNLALDNLGCALHSHFKLYGHWNDLQRAIELQEEALGNCPAGDPNRALYLDGAGDSISTRYSSTGHLDDSERAFQLLSEALELRPLGNPRRRQSLHNLACFRRNRYLQETVKDDLDRAVQLHAEALELCPRGHRHPDWDKFLKDQAETLTLLSKANAQRESVQGTVSMQESAPELELVEDSAQPAANN